MPQRRRPPSEWTRIREVFLERHESYASADVPRLLGIPERTVRHAIEQGTITAVAVDGEPRVAWEDVVALGLEQRWTYGMLTAALRRCDEAPLPALVRVVAGRVRLPRYQWEILRFLAGRRAHAEGRQLTASDLLEEAVSTALLTTIDDWEPLEALLPGVRAAAAWPSAD